MDEDKAFALIGLAIVGGVLWIVDIEGLQLLLGAFALGLAMFSVGVAGQRVED